MLKNDKKKIIDWENVHFQDIKKLARDHRTIKKVVENITKLRSLWEVAPRNKRKLKQVVAKQLLLTNSQIFEKTKIGEPKGVEYFVNWDM